MQEVGAPRQPEHIGILALEVYIPPTYVSKALWNPLSYLATTPIKPLLSLSS